MLVATHPATGKLESPTAGLRPVLEDYPLPQRALRRDTEAARDSPTVLCASGVAQHCSTLSACLLMALITSNKLLTRVHLIISLEAWT